MNQKIEEIKTELSELKNEYKKVLDKTMPEIYSRLDLLKNLDEKIINLEKKLNNFSPQTITQPKKIENSKEIGQSEFLPKNFNFSKKDSEKANLFPIIKKQDPLLIIFITNIIKAVSVPFESLFETFAGFYRHYQKQGKGPVFLMTLGGIIALVSGFSYLIKYSFSNFFNEWAKALTVFFCGTSIIFFSKILYSKKEGMHDFASGLTGLGIIINYLAIYAAGPFYSLIPSYFSFFLLILNTLAAFFLAVYLNTRIVSFIAMAGGIFFPLALGNNGQSTDVYLLYLLFLSIITLLVAKKIKWEELSYITMISSLFMVEASVSKLLFHIIIVHFFYWVYSYFLLFDKKKIKNALSKKEIIVLSALFIYLTGSIINLSWTPKYAGYFLCLNSIISLALFFRFINEKLKSFFIIFSGLFAGIAVLNLVSPDIAGAIWGIEALLLIYAGFKFNEIFVRKEGYLIFLVSITSIIFSIVQGFFSNNFDLVILSFINLFSAGFFIFVLRILMEKNEQRLDGTEKTILYISDNAVFVWISSVWLFILNQFFLSYLLILAAAPLPYFLYRAGKRKLVFGEFFAFFHLLFPGLQIIYSGSSIKSFIFVDLDIAGKIAQLEIFFSFILIYHIYKRFNKTGYFFKASKLLRNLFFIIIPISFLPSSFKYLYGYMPVLLWVSVAVAICLYYYLKKSFMFLEFEILSLGASAFSIFYSLIYIFNNNTYDYFSMSTIKSHEAVFYSIRFGILSGILLFLAVLFFTGGFRKKDYNNDPFKRIYHGAFIYFGYSLFLYTSIICKSVAAGICAWSLFSLYAAFKRPVKPWFENTYNFFFTSYLFLVFPSLIFIMSGTSNLNIVLTTIPFIIFGILIHRENYFLHDKNKLFTNKKILYFFFNFLAAFLFAAYLENFNINFTSPLLTIFLVIQGTILLFGTLKPIYFDCMKIPATVFLAAFLKLVFMDLRGLPVTGKIIAFMGVGMVLIAGAYQFQQLKTKYSTNRTDI
jgi:hypothetical protein